MEVRPILSALARNSAGAILVSLQIAITLAIVVNAVFLVKQRVVTVNRPTGMDEQNMFSVRVTGFGKDFNFHDMVRSDMDLLRRLPGIVDATNSPQVPLSGGGSSSRYYTEPGEKGRSEPVNYFETDDHSVNALGVALASGKPFEPQDVEWRKQESQAPVASGKVIVSKGFADRIFPNENALGKSIYDNLGQPLRIVGVMEHMQGSWLSWDKVDSTMLVPLVNPGPSTQYIVRARPGELDRVMASAEAALKAAMKERVVGKLEKMSVQKDRSYSSDTLIVVILGVVTGLVVIFSSLGIFGLATFNVNTRTRQIGTRRAIGARRIDIVRYFLVENWMVTTAGVVVGCVLTLLGGFWLATRFGLARLDLYYLVGGVLGLWAVGQLAAWQPSLKASKVSPAMATRNV
ncbi:MAG TPA: FtsX-like permease family protein [Steroidobacteraceae bacterium]|nr:FtsX-like permease family protein [Steroidobacteraceae bacterium]